MNCCPFPSSLDSKNKSQPTPWLRLFLYQALKACPPTFPTSPLSKLKALKYPKQTDSYSTRELSSKTIFHSSSLGDTTVLLSLLGRPSPRIIITKPRMETSVAWTRLHLLPKGDHTPTQYEGNCFVLSRYFFKHNSQWYVYMSENTRSETNICNFYPLTRRWVASHADVLTAFLRASSPWEARRWTSVSLSCGIPLPPPPQGFEKFYIEAFEVHVVGDV